MLQKCFKNASKILVKLVKNPAKISNKISAELSGPTDAGLTQNLS